MRRFHALAAAVMAATLVAAGGCSGSDDNGGGSGGDGKSLDKVSLMTAFGKVGRDAFAWVGKEKGFFKEAGIDLTIQPGAGTGENIKALAAGKVQFANLDIIGGWITQGKAGAEYKDFRTIAAIHQGSLVSIITLEGSGINSPKDLEGKKIGAATNSVNQLLFPAYARLAGVDDKKVTWVNTQPPQIPALLASGQVPAVSTFLLGQKGIEKAAGGKKAVIFPYNDYLTDLFGNGIVTTKDIADNKPDLAKRFRDASLKALKYTIEHPDEAAQILHKAEPSADVAAAKGEITLMTPYVTAGLNGAPMGSMDQERVARAIAIIQGAGLIAPGLKPEDVVDFDLTPKP